jgi:hypothetical protein
MLPAPELTVLPDQRQEMPKKYQFLRCLTGDYVIGCLSPIGPAVPVRGLQRVIRGMTSPSAQKREQPMNHTKNPGQAGTGTVVAVVCQRSRSFVKPTLILMSLLLCVGCQMDKRFARLQPGMTRSQVVGILGQPDADKPEDSSEVLRWNAGNHYVKLKNGRVTEYGAGD